MPLRWRLRSSCSDACMYRSSVFLQSEVACSQFLALQFGTTCRLMSHLRHRWRFSDSAIRHFCSRFLILTLSFDSQTICFSYLAHCDTLFSCALEIFLLTYLSGLTNNCVIGHVKNYYYSLYLASLRVAAISAAAPDSHADASTNESAVCKWQSHPKLPACLPAME